MKLCDHNSCTGCGACAAKCPRNAIAMVPDQSGFLYPEVGDACINCGLCEKTCPVLNGMPETEKLSVYTGWHEDASIREKSTSGGIFTAIAEAFQPDYIYGAAWKTDFSGVHHVEVAGVENIAPLRGAKYAQSNMTGIYQQIAARLKENKKVIFSGTPCQAAGLKAYLGEKYPADQLLCIDCICRGAPAPEAWKAYVQYRAEQDADGKLPQTINMRSKRTGWGQYSIVFQYPSGKEYAAKSSQDPYMRLFVGDYINRLSCAECPFKGLNHPGDLTLGDFWGIWDIDPAYNDNKGCSIVAAHNETAEKVLQLALHNSSLRQWVRAGKVLETDRIQTPEALFAQNPAMLKVFPVNERRQEALTYMAENQAARAIELLPVQTPPKKLSMIQRIRIHLGL